MFGDRTRAVKWIDFRFAAGADGTKVLLASPGVDPKYLYYAICNLSVPSRGYNRHWTVLRDLRIPIPPIKLQQEIVQILDLFQSLEAELEARGKQYTYYRDQLLTFREAGVRWVTLLEVAEKLDSRRKPVTKGDREAGEYPYYGASGIVDYVSDFIFDGDYLLVSEDGANLLVRSTPIAFLITGRTWVNNHAHVLSFNSYEERRFVEIYLNSIDLSPHVSGGAQPKLNQANMNKVEIPWPPLGDQRRIVTVLDKFDVLVNDLSVGLPAELAARRKQYEHYRDTLLTFQELS